MRMTLQWLSQSHAAAAICTDSESLLKVIQSDSAETAERMLNKRGGKVTLLWIPGPQGIAGNEEADACAKQAAAITDSAHQPFSFGAASAIIRRTLTAPPPCYCRIREVYTNTFSCPADCRAVSTGCHAHPHHPPPTTPPRQGLRQSA